LTSGPGDVAFVRQPGSRGILWLRRAFAMLKAARAQWLSLLLAFYLVQLVVGLIPYAGPIAMMVLRPVFTVGFLAAAWTQERGGMPSLRHLVRGFRANLGALIPIGVFLLVGTLVAVLASIPFDGGALVDAIKSAEPTEEALPNPKIQLGMLASIVFALPVVAAAWFAPALVVFNNCSSVRALATSLRAVIANWKPLAVYGLIVALYGAVFPAMGIALIASLLPESAARIAVALTIVPYVFVFITVQTISDYVSYRDIFHPEEVTQITDARDPGAGSGTP
jgi:uncharacterized membrane protein